MDRIRLIASDMDATLLDGHSQLPPDFLHLVQELAGQDILFAAASGRPLYKLEEMFAPVLEQTLLVADNGGAARWRGKDLFVSRMEPEVWHRLTACAEENGDSFVVCGLENAYLRPCDRCYDAVYRNFYNRIAYVSRICTPSTPQWTSLPSICRRTMRRRCTRRSTVPASGRNWPWRCPANAGST